MPERDKYPREYFEGNPYEAETPWEMYEKLRWGNASQETFEVDAPEAMATLGDVAVLDLGDCQIRFDEDEAPYLAVGHESNRLYIVPADENGPVDIPESGFVDLGEVRQIDYYSDKGGEAAYYYHEHEAPYPRLLIHPCGVMMLEPSEMEDGSRSFAVSDEGIIG